VLVTGGVTLSRAQATTTLTRPSIAGSAAATIPQISPQTATPAGGCRIPAALPAAQVPTVMGRHGWTPTVIGPPVPARPLLRQLATQIRGTGCEATVGRYAYAQVRQWAADTAVLRDHVEVTLIRFAEQRWRAADGSGRTVTARHPATDAPALVDLTHTRGGLAAVLDRPAATDPALLASQLNDLQPFANGPQSPLRALADLAGWHTASAQVRAASVAVLRDTDGLRYHGPAVDRAGRRGIALSALSAGGATRDLLLLDPATAVVLAYEMAHLHDLGRLDIPRPRIENYLLFLGHRRLHTTRPPPASADPIQG
jgi:hypothetical protein